ncbi:MAG: carboxyl-terminal processing protease [Rickettsiales bacterium]|jgi:carboxyl-terminal processing protease
MQKNIFSKIYNLAMKHPLKSILIFFIIVTYSAISYSKNDPLKLTLNLPDKITKKSVNDDFLANIVKRVKEDYVEEKTDKELSEAAASGILSSLDPHSSYLDADDLKEMTVQTSGEFGGLGIEITTELSLIKIISPIEGTPAQKAGIQAGDYISRINSKSVVGLKIGDVVKKLRGKPGTKVAITILRKNEKAPIELVIERQIIKIKAVRANIENDIAYVKINSFSGQASYGVKEELEKLIKKIGSEKIKGIVLDLRNNPGGLLNEAVKVSDIFLDKGQTIVSISGRNKSNEKIYKDKEDQTLTKGTPVVILINPGSASASEIVAGALQDHKRAIILGVKSFGKGSVQSIIPLDQNHGALKMTTALYYTPSGKSIQAHGINPDVIVDNLDVKVSENKSVARSEESLEGHLKNQIEEELKEAEVSGENINSIDLYEKDYQLARAIDLLRGISVYRSISK